MATPTVNQHPLLPRVATLKEGSLLKRQRGQKSNADLRKLKFQPRYIRLTQETLTYYSESRKIRGEFPVTRIRIIEKVPDATFQKSSCFQIGDEMEIMYFKAESDDERKQWIETLRIASALAGNAMLQSYHQGAYGQVHQQKWSCCNAANRDTQGCQQTTYEYGKQHTRIRSLQVVSRSGRKIHSPRPFGSVHDGSNSRKEQKEITVDAGQDPQSLVQEKIYTSASVSDNDVYPSASDDDVFPSASDNDDVTDNLILIHQDSMETDLGDVTTGTVSNSEHTGQIKYPSHRSSLSSIDSGISDSRISGTSGSLLSLTSDRSRAPSLSPLIQHRQNRDALSSKENTYTITQQYQPPWLHGPTHRKSSWTFQELAAPPSQSEVVSALFRGVDTLILALKDGSVQKTNTGKLKEHYISVLNKIDIIREDDSAIGPGSVDIWKNYLAVGSTQLRVVNLDGGSILLKTICSEVLQPYPYLVAFTPGGELLSYNCSQPDTIKVWPKVESLWSSFNAEGEKQLVVKHADNAESLSVSPSPSHPWFAITTKELLQVYDYTNQELKSQLKTGDKITVVSFSPHGKYIAIVCGKHLKLHDVQSNTTISQFSEIDASITSLAHNPWPENIHLAVGLNNGEVRVYGDLQETTSTPKFLASLNSPRASARLTYSKDGCTLAAVDSSGMTRLWKVPVKLRSGFREIPLAREGKLKVDSKGFQYVSPDDGYAILFPPGAISEGNTVTYEHGVVPDGPFGPFEFPVGVRPVSAIIFLHPTTDQTLLKPIDIVLPHIMHSEGWERLSVYKADCHGKEENGKLIYSFKEIANVNLAFGTYYGDSNYREGIPYAKFSTYHLCYICIGIHDKEYTDTANFTLFEVKPKVLDQSEDLLIHFCLTYCLSTCHKTIRDQYPENEYILNSLCVVFSGGEDNSAIGIDFEERLGSWHFSLQGGRGKEITQKDICFWDLFPTTAYVKDMCDAKIYPPRFSVCIRGRPNDEVKAEFKFTGAVLYPGTSEPISVVYLPLPAQKHQRALSSSGYSTLSRVNSDYSVTSQASARTVTHLTGPLSPQNVNLAAKAFKACMCDLDNVHPSQLALNLFANDIIEDETVESTQASFSTKDKMYLQTDLLFKVYNALKVNADLTPNVQKALQKLNSEVAGKFASMIIERPSRELSSSGTSESTCSLLTASDTAPTNEAEVSTAVDERIQDSNSDHDIVTTIQNGSSSVSSESIFSSYSPIRVSDNLPGMIVFNKQASQTPTDPCSEVTEQDLEETHQACTRYYQ